MAKTRTGWLNDSALAKRVRGLYGYQQVEVLKIPPERRLEGWDEITKGYTPAEARLEALRCLQCQDPSCVKACPAHLNVPGYLQAIVDGDYKRGLQIIMDTYPLAGTCGRVCFHPCADVCLKSVLGESLNIPRLRRFLTDTVSPYDLDYNILPATGFKIAVIGSGPAGLACAYHSRRRGHEVVVFEKGERAGGTLNILPDYRLPKAVLQADIKVLEWLGVQIKTDSPVHGDGCIDRLLAEFDAVFIGAGAIGSSKPKMPGNQLPGTTTGLEYLWQTQRGHPPAFERLAIIGGGDVAMDCLGTALRSAKVVHWIYRRGPEEMPAHEAELLELGEEVVLRDLHELARTFTEFFKQNALHEARARLLTLTMEERRRWQKEIEKNLKAQLAAELARHGDQRRLVVHLLTNPTTVLGEERVQRLECVRMKLGEPDKSGRREPVPMEGSEFTIDVDGVIFAIGQNVESSWLGQESGIELTKWGEMVVDKDTQATSRPRVFAGGDGVRGPASMIDALADGIRAANAIDALLRRGEGPHPRPLSRSDRRGVTEGRGEGQESGIEPAKWGEMVVDI